jgi:O-antigen/teichoic acid export membrane protein
VAAPALLFVILIWRGLFSLSGDTALAIVLLAIGLIPSGLATGLASVFYAYEKMEYPAAITTVTTLLKVSLGALALILGFGFIGLAGVSIVVNVITFSILLRSLVRNFFLPRYESDSGLMREMVGLSYPLMINHLLATLFFKVDVSLLQPMKGDRVVGLYGAAYKFIDGLQIIPVTFTVAVFPILSRYAESAKGSLLKAYSLAVKLLFVVALPCAIAITFVARELIVILGGGEYLPDSMIALQIMVWSIPLGFINSVTQYALIALNQQRFLTKAFLAGLSLNIIGNLLFIPMYSYKASAAIHIFSELALLVLFYRCISRSLTRINWLEIFYRPAMAGGLMVGSIWLLREASPLFALLAGGILYLLALFLIGTFSEEEMGLIKELLPFELKRVFPILRRMHVRKR